MRVRLSSFVLCLVLAISSLAYASTIRYTVQDGDILGSIASRHSVTVADIVRWNPSLDPDRIRVGQTLVIRPGTAATAQASGGSSSDEYIVRSGDTLTGIAARLGVSYDAIVRANRNLDPDRLQIGQRLRIPQETASSRGSSAAGRVHVVQSGDTVSAIAARYAVSVADLQGWNRGLNIDRISVGQRIHIRSARPVRELTYTIKAGDILGRVAERHNVTVSELVSWNNGLNPDRIRVGQTVRIFQEGPEHSSESVGSAADGRLVNGEQLRSGTGYRVRSSRRAWGTNHTIELLQGGYAHMVRRFPNIPRIAVHDLSAQNGGPLTPHRSHQSGRDADIGYYHNTCSRTDCEYRAVSASELNPEYQWELFRYWIEEGSVEYLFVDYTLQERLYNHAKSIGTSQRTLDRAFQYPRGRHSSRGIIRHEPGHRTHFHVRFSCARGDTRCR